VEVYGRHTDTIALVLLDVQMPGRPHGVPERPAQELLAMGADVATSLRRLVERAR
jgi:hypothetical protein